MKKKLLFTLLTLGMALPLASCGGSGADLEIVLEDGLPSAYVGEEYDFEDNIVIEDKVTYTLQAFYQDYYEMKEYELPVDGFVFTPVKKADLSVVIHASKGGAKATRTVTLEVLQRGDPIDELLASDGMSGWADGGFRKELTTEASYLKEEGSVTALNITYNGNNEWVWGAAVFCADNFRLLDYWSDKTWENAIITFWVYNPTDYPIEFQLRLFDGYLNQVNCDWGQPIQTPQVADAGEWTQVFFSLRKYGVTHTLFKNEEGTRTDSVTVKAKWGGTPTTKPTPVYGYQFYVDGFDIAPASKYPDVDTKDTTSAEDISYGLENAELDTSPVNGYGTANVKFDREVVNSTTEHESLSSAWLTFDNTTIKDYRVGYSFILNIEVEQTVKGNIDTLPDFSHGLLTADFMFSEDVSNTSIKILAVNDGWDTNAFSSEIALSDLGNGWKHLEVDLAVQGDLVNIKKVIRLGFLLVGVTEENKNTAVVHIDNILFDQNGGTTPVSHRGVRFTSETGYVFDFEPVDVATGVVVIDLLLDDTSSESAVCIGLFDNSANWDNAFRWIHVYGNGTASTTNGVAISTTDDGYMRVTFTLSQITVSTDTRPTNIAHIQLRNEWTNVAGYAEYFINPQF